MSTVSEAVEAAYTLAPSGLIATENGLFTTVAGVVVVQGESWPMQCVNVSTPVVLLRENSSTTFEMEDAA